MTPGTAAVISTRARGARLNQRQGEWPLCPLFPMVEPARQRRVEATRTSGALTLVEEARQRRLETTPLGVSPMAVVSTRARGARLNQREGARREVCPDPLVEEARQRRLETTPLGVSPVGAVSTRARGARLNRRDRAPREVGTDPLVEEARRRRLETTRTSRAVS